MDQKDQSPLAQPGVWNLVAAGYVEDNVPMFEKFAESALALVKPRPGARIVDVACGPGTLSLLAARRVAHVDALDFSPDMVKHLQARAASAGVTNIEARVGDGQALPYVERSFDAGFSMFGLMFFHERDRGFAELRRVLKPGARAVVSSWQVAPRDTVIWDILEVLAGAMPNFPAPGSPGPLGDPAEFRRELHAAGFDEIDVQPVTHVGESESVDATWASLERSMPPIAMLKQRLPPPMFAKIADAIVAKLRARFGTGKVPLPMAAWFGTGIA